MRWVEIELIFKIGFVWLKWVLDRLINRGNKWK